MKKHISLMVGVLLFGTVLIAEAAAGQFMSDLKFGTENNDVAELQSVLIGKGFRIPSIESGRVSKGYFGRETLAAVRKFQTTNKLPSTGFVGPLTRGVLNGTSAPLTAAPESPVALTTITTPGVSGTLALTLQTTPASGTRVNKGQTVDIAQYKVQAGASDMRLTSVALDFDNRLWLYASSISLLDGATVVGTVSNLNSTNFSELTVGTNYRITIPTNVIVSRGGTKYLTVQISSLPVTDRTSATVSLTRIETRAVDGTGYVDTQTLTSTRSFSYVSTGNGTIVAYANPQSPPNMTVPISTAGPTDNVVLGVADFKSEARDGIMRSMTVYMNANFDLSSSAITTLVDDIKIQSGDKIYSADTIGGTADFVAGLGTPVTFTNMEILLPKDQLVPVAILLKIKQNTNNSLDGKAASSTLIADGSEGGTSNNPLVETTDAAHTAMGIFYAPLLTSDITVTSKNSSFDYTAPVVAKLGQPVLSSGSVISYPVTFGFSVTAGDSTLYVSADPNTALSTSSVGLPNDASASLPLGGVTVNPGNIAGDTNTTSASGYYILPAGSTRSFTYSGSVSNTNGTKGMKSFSIDGFRYGTTTSALNGNTIVYYNYGALKVNPIF